MGEQARDLARKVLPIRGRHQDEAERRAREVDRRAQIGARVDQRAVHVEKYSIHRVVLAEYSIKSPDVRGGTDGKYGTMHT